MSRYFAGKPGQPRARRAGDVVLVVVGMLLVAWTAGNVDDAGSHSNAWFVHLLDPLPPWFGQIWKVGYFAGLILVIALFVGAVWRRRLSLVRDLTVAVTFAVAGGILAALWLSDAFPTLLPEVTRPVEPDLAFPIIRVGAITAAIVVAGPHVTRPVRILGWGTVILVAFSGFGLGYGLPSDAIGAVGLGLVTGGATLLLFGSPRGYPDVDEIAAALSDLGVDTEDLTVVPDRSWGVRTLVGTLSDGRAIDVLAYGRDAADTRMAAKTWRSIWYRDGDRTVTFSRSEAVEHEALAMLMASRAGVATQAPLAVGIAGDDLALLARSDDGTAVAQPTPAQLVAAWRQVAALHEAGMAHGSLTLDALRQRGDEIVLGNFTHASFTPTESRIGIDIASLLYETAVAADAETAVEAARQVVSSERLIEAVAYLQVPALTPAQRKLVDKPKAVLTEVRDVLIEATGAEPPEPARLRRIKPSDLIMPALSLIAAYALIGMLIDIDFGAVWDVVRDANWTQVVVGFLVGQTAFFFEATAMLFATGYPLPMAPLIVLQLAVKWIGLAIPSAAGRVTMNTLFLRKYGVSPTIAVTQGAIDGLSGFVVEALILLVSFLISDLSLGIDVGADDVPWGAIVLTLVVVVVGVVVAVFRVARLRDLVLPVVRDAWRSLSSVLKSPKRTFGLLGSNLASRLILALVLYLILQAIGTPLPFPTCLIVTVATNLLAGLVPIPGGIGVAEAVLTSYLILAGIPDDAAFAAAVVFRVATFYIPAAEGFLATKWLEQGDYL